MTFTPAELRQLAAADTISTPKGGRPRTRPSTPAQERRRARALARYYRLKETRHGR